MTFPTNSGEPVRIRLHADTEPMLIIASEYAFHKTLKPVTIIDSV